MNDFVTLAKKRRTVHKYTNEPVSRQAIMNILEAARWAPNGYNLQPWHFIVVESQAQRDCLIQALQHEADRKVSQGFKTRVAEYLKHITTFIVIVADPTKKKEFPPHRTGATADKIFISTLSAAIQNIHLAAAEQGLGSVWATVGSEPETQAEFKSVLNIPAEYEVMYLIPIGHPVEPLNEPDPSERKPLDSIVSWEFFKGK